METTTLNRSPAGTSLQHGPLDRPIVSEKFTNLATAQAEVSRLQSLYPGYEVEMMASPGRLGSPTTYTVQVFKA